MVTKQIARRINIELILIPILKIHLPNNNSRNVIPQLSEKSGCFLKVGVV